MPTLLPRRCRPAVGAAALTFVAGLCAANASLAATRTYSGALDDPANQALVGSGLGAAQSDQ
jgi:hypothetical protein